MSDGPGSYSPLCTPGGNWTSTCVKFRICFERTESETDQFPKTRAAFNIFELSYLQPLEPAATNRLLCMFDIVPCEPKQQSTILEAHLPLYLTLCCQAIIFLPLSSTLKVEICH